jgi:hypothetical protein
MHALYDCGGCVARVIHKTRRSALDDLSAWKEMQKISMDMAIAERRSMAEGLLLTNVAAPKLPDFSQEQRGILICAFHAKSVLKTNTYMD